MQEAGEGVTVLMPVYNGGAYLEAAVESIRRQTYREFEFLILDNGSTDGSGNLLEKLAAADARIRLVRLPHQEETTARNRGLTLARGSVIICMDADDVSLPDRIEQQLTFLASHPEVAAVGAAMRVIDKDGTPIGSVNHPLTPEEVLQSLRAGNCALAHPTAAMRRAAVLAVGGYRSLYQYADDFDLWLRLSECHALANLPTTLLDYRWHGSNWSLRRRREQALAAHVAKLAARERRLGRPDPTIGLDGLSVGDLDRFNLPRHERNAILFDLSEAALVAYGTSLEARYLTDAEGTLLAHGYGHPARARRIAFQLAQHLWTIGERGRAISVLAWAIRSELSNVGTALWPTSTNKDLATAPQNEVGNPTRQDTAVLGGEAAEEEAPGDALHIGQRDHSESVTVLMPVYNGGAYLEAAIESIRRQTYCDFEFLIVDDGSSDNSGELLHKAAAQDPRIRIFVGMHEGIAAALNRGLAMAKGSIIVRMDADDVAIPERLERQLTYLADHPEIVAVGSAMRLVDTSGSSLGPSNYPLSSEEVRKCLLAGSNALAHPTVAMRREIVLAAGGYRPAFKFAEDFDLWLRLSEHHLLANMPDVFLEYRCHGRNTTARRRREQALAAHVARLAAHQRSLGRDDPTVGLEQLCVSDLDRFELDCRARGAILLDLSEAGLSAYDATGEPRHLAAVEETLYMQGHPRGASARRAAAQLARYLWKAKYHRRSATAALWKIRSQMLSVAQHAQPRLARTERNTRRAIDNWLIHCADPLRREAPPPRRPLCPAEEQELVVQADMHGVLPAVLRHFPAFQGTAETNEAKSAAVARHRSALAYSLMLRSHGDALMAAAAGLPVVMVKGPTFSRTIYPTPGLRTFTDIDLLTTVEAEPQLARLLDQQGFRLAAYDRDPERQEWKWLHRDNEALMIEVHTNLVHHPDLRASMSLRFQDLDGIAETPAALLTVAVVHGALHRFERLRQVVDICQAARQIDSAEEERRFEILVRRTGARFAAIAGLDLAYRLFAEPRCRDVARGLGPARYTGLARLLIGRSAVASTMSSRRAYHSWRRQGFRILLKHSRAF